MSAMSVMRGRWERQRCLKRCVRDERDMKDEKDEIESWRK